MISRKIHFFPLVVFLGLMAAGSPFHATDTAGASASTIPPADPLASPKTKAVLNYLFNLPTGTSNRIISGQFEELWGSSNASMRNDINGIYQKTGKYVGIMGRDYRWDDVKSANSLMIDFSKSGGLITMTYHFDNPVGRGNAWDLTYVDFTQLTTPGTSSNKNLNAELDKIAAGFAELQANDVVVLFRNMPEMDAGWFWWGGHTPSEFKSLWIYIFNYLTRTKNIHNLLYVYAGNAALNQEYFPGKEYVDIVGVDYYGTGIYDSAVRGYENLAWFGKPFALVEWGACRGGITWEPQNCVPMDISRLVHGLKTYMPETTYWMNWNGVYSMNYNLNTDKMLSDPWVITRDEISIPGDSSDTTPPAAPTGMRVR